MCWLGINGIQEMYPLIYLLVLYVQSQLIDVWLLIDEVSISHIATHDIRLDSSGRVVSSSQRPLPDNTQNSQQTDMYAPGGIRTHDLRRRAAADLRLKPRGHWDRQYVCKSKCEILQTIKSLVNCKLFKLNNTQSAVRLTLVVSLSGSTGNPHQRGINISR